MQSKINNFFMPLSSSPTRKSANPSQCCIAKFDYGRVQPEILVTYQRRPQNSICEKNGVSAGEASKEIDLENIVPNLGVTKSGKVLNKKRKYAQFYLELGLIFYYTPVLSVALSMPEVMKRMKSFIRRFTRIIRIVFHLRVGGMKENFEFLHLKLDELSWCWTMTLLLREIRYRKL